MEKSGPGCGSKGNPGFPLLLSSLISLLSPSLIGPSSHSLLSRFVALSPFLSFLSYSLVFLCSSSLPLFFSWSPSLFILFFFTATHVASLFHNMWSRCFPKKSYVVNINALKLIIWKYVILNSEIRGRDFTLYITNLCNLIAKTEQINTNSRYEINIYKKMELIFLLKI